MFDKIGGRKFIASLIVMGVAAAIEIYGKNGLSTNMAGLLGAIYATFSATNAFTTVKTASSEQPAGAATPPPPDIAQAIQPLVPVMNQVGSELAAIKAQQEQQLSALTTIQKAIGALLQR